MIRYSFSFVAHNYYISTEDTMITIQPVA